MDAYFLDRTGKSSCGAPLPLLAPIVSLGWPDAVHHETVLFPLVAKGSPCERIDGQSRQDIRHEDFGASGVRASLGLVALEGEAIPKALAANAECRRTNATKG